MEIRINNVKVGYNKNYPTLNIHKWSLEGSEKCLLVSGPNGSGKTTFLKLLVKDVPYYSGELYISFDGIIVKSISELLPLVGVFLGPIGFSYKHLTLKENIDLFFLLYQPQEIIFQQKLIESFLLLELLDTKISKLSIGQRKRIDLFFCFLNNPKCIIIDEPLEYLDEKSKSNFLEIVDYFINFFDTKFIFSTNMVGSFTLNNSIKVVNVKEFQL